MTTVKVKKSAVEGGAPETTSYPDNVKGHLRPGYEFAQYIPRVINGIQDLSILDYARANALNVLLYSPTGAGKTTLAKAYAAKHGLPFYNVSCNGSMTTEKMLGGWVNVAGQWQWQDGVVTLAFRHGGVLSIDELNMAKPSIMAALHEALDSRRQLTLDDKGGEVVKGHKDLLIISAYNPDYAGTYELNEATKNRFALKFPWDYDPEVEEALIPVDALRRIAKSIRDLQKQGDVDSACSTNLLMEFLALTDDIGLGFAIDNFKNAFKPWEQDAISNVLRLERENLRAELEDHLGRDPEVGFCLLGDEDE